MARRLTVAAPMALLLAFLSLSPAQAQSQTPGPPPSEPTGVSLQGLDKITARIFAFDAPLDQSVRFGHLQITARACDVSDKTEVPERAAFLEIVEAKPGKPEVRVFSGWMFASSPSVSAMEHPVYDVWVVDCAGYKPEEVTPTGEAPKDEQIEAPTDDAERPLD